MCDYGVCGLNQAEQHFQHHWAFNWVLEWFISVIFQMSSEWCRISMRDGNNSLMGMVRRKQLADKKETRQKMSKKFHPHSTSSLSTLQLLKTTSGANVGQENMPLRVGFKTEPLRSGEKSNLVTGVHSGVQASWPTSCVGVLGDNVGNVLLKYADIKIFQKLHWS